MVSTNDTYSSRRFKATGYYLSQAKHCIYLTTLPRSSIIKPTTLIRKGRSKMKKVVIISVIALAVLVAMGIYGTQLAWGDDAPVVDYHDDKNYSFITDIDKTEQTEILEILNITIPESETEAFIYSFGYKEGKSKNGSFTFIVEIGGVRDHKAFFDKNSDKRFLNQIESNSHYEDKNYIVYAKNYDYLSQQNIRAVDSLTEFFEK